MLRIINDTLMASANNPQSPPSLTQVVFTLAITTASVITFIKCLAIEPPQLLEKTKKKKPKPMAHHVDRPMTKKEQNKHLQNQRRHAEAVERYSKRVENQRPPAKKVERYSNLFKNLSFEDRSKLESAVHEEKARQAEAQEKENQRLAEATKAEQASKQKRLDAWFIKKHRIGPFYRESAENLSLTSTRQKPSTQNRPG